MVDNLVARGANMTDTERIATIWPWYNGNGNIGAKDRLNRLDNIVNGKEQCRAMEEIKGHKKWHEKMSGRRWDIYAGFTLVILSVILTRVL